MTRRSGQILIQVLVFSALLISICMSLVSSSIHVKTMRQKFIKSEDASAELDGATARVWGCLADEGYPPQDSCRPKAVQLACVPEGMKADFSGSAPDCRVALSVDR